MDKISREHRSWNMSQIRSKDTKPEIIIRSLLHNKGFRFRLHRRDLPGKPDLVFSKYKAIIFVNGCFWHMHGCKNTKIPSTRSVWWRKKLHENVERDNKSIKKLINSGWRVLTIWECSIKENQKTIPLLINAVEDWLNSNSIKAQSSGIFIEEISL